MVKEGFTIKVDPAELQMQAGMLEGSCNNMQTRANTIIGLIEKTRFCMQSDAADLQRTELKRQVEVIRNQLEYLKAYANQVRRIGGVYEATAVKVNSAVRFIPVNELKSPFED